MGGEWWYRFNKRHNLRTTSLPPMPTGNYTTQMEFWANPKNSMNGSSIIANWGRVGKDLTTDTNGLNCGSDVLQLLVNRLRVKSGYLNFNNSTFYPPHTGANTSAYKSQPVTGLNGTVYQSGQRTNVQWSGLKNYIDPLLPPTLATHTGRHVVTGALNFNQEGNDLIASIGRATIYIDNILVADMPLQSGMQQMIFPGFGIFQIGSGSDYPDYVKHIRMYDGVIDKSMLDALPTAI
jgi:hypothetical protein